ncbi:MAG: hypothetical protein H2069_04395 [Legionella sp.]|nr:hypothetical protein [Legionella sp.]
MKKKFEINDVLIFFKENPYQSKYRRKEQDSLSSYIKEIRNDGSFKIIRLKNKSEEGYKLGEGASGHVKKTESEGKETCVKINAEYNKNLSEKEAKINLDMGIGIGPLIIIRNKNVTKTYQEMKNMGLSLESQLNNLSCSDKIEILPNLILTVYDMHAGVTSLTKTKYKHGDLYVGNILMDKDKNFHIIDFSTSDIAIEENFEQDNFHLLNMIFCPTNYRKKTIFNQEDLENFQKSIKDFFFLNKNEHKDLKSNQFLLFLAALFIILHEDNKFDNLDDLKNDINQQKNIVEKYRRNKFFNKKLNDNKDEIKNFFDTDKLAPL